MGEFKSSKDYHERHLKIAKELGDTLGEGKACASLGNSFEVLGQCPAAINYYQLAINLFNNIRGRLQFKDELKISLRDRFQTVYAALWWRMVD